MGYHVFSVYKKETQSVIGAHVARGGGEGSIPRDGGGVRERFFEEVAQRQSEKGREQPVSI